MPHSACVRCSTCDGFPCLVHAKSDAEVLGVRPALEHPNVTLMTNAQAVRLETNAAGTSVTGVVVERDGAHETHTADLVVVVVRGGQQRAAAARVGERQASRRPGQRLRPGRAQLHVPQLRRRAGALQGAQPDGLPEDARPQRLLLRHRRRRLPARATSRWSASRRPRCTAARSRSRRGWRPSGRSTRSPGTPSTSGCRPRTCRCPENRVTLRADRSITARPTRATNDEPKKRLLHELKGAAQAPRDAARPPAAAPRLPQERDPGRGLRPPGRDLPLRDRPGAVGAQHRLPRPRGRQPLRRRHELLPEHRRGEPGADGDGQRACAWGTTCCSAWACRSTRAEHAHAG